jgi:uncharacterized protein DUF6448
MGTSGYFNRNLCAIGLGVAMSLALSGIASAHCDTMDGPVVAAARAALEKGDITTVLKWVKPEREREIRAAFARTLAVRAGGSEAKQLADMYFFETLVRVHRAGEGAPYSGLQPAGTPIEPSISLADRALATGNADGLVKSLTGHAEEGIRERFTRAAAAKKHAEESVAAGREFVEAYVEFTHYVERLERDAATSALAHAGSVEEASAGHKH